MKLCPICGSHGCYHEKKFFQFGLIKLIIIKKSIDKALNIFVKLVSFLPTDREINFKLNTALEDLYSAQKKVDDVRKWCETKTK